MHLFLEIKIRSWNFQSFADFAKFTFFLNMAALDDIASQEKTLD